MSLTRVKSSTETEEVIRSGVLNKTPSSGGRLKVAHSGSKHIFNNAFFLPKNNTLSHLS